MFIGGIGGKGTSYSGGNCGQNISKRAVSSATPPSHVYANSGTDIGGEGGGLLIVYGKSIWNKNTILSNGKTGSYGNGTGGGSVNLFYRENIEEGTIEAKGGTSKSSGGNGGNGCIAITKMEN
ncbi:MAG: hypothetical protein HFJ34_03895 [Clostridia bacterium]|nr:hypothetical protein [Clostridia bacterium]